MHDFEPPAASRPDPAGVARWLGPDSECAGLIASRNWAGTPLGPIEGWPGSLRTALGMVLHSPVPMVMLWGEDGVMLYNDAYSVFAGGRHPDLLGAKVREGWPEVAEFNDNVMRVGLAGGTLSYKDQELTLFRRGVPEQVFMNLDYSPVIGENGRPAGVLAIVIETTDRILAARARHEAEAALNDERDRARNVLENITDGFILLDPDFRVLDINAEGMRYEQRARSQIVGRSHWEVWPGSEESVVGALYKQAMRTREPVAREHLYRWPDGRSAWIDMRAYPSGDGLAIFYRDVTERHRTTALASQAAERVQLALDAGAIIGTWVWDVQADLFFADDRFAASFDVDPERCREGLPLAEVAASIHDDDADRVEAAIAEALERGGAYRCEYRVRQQDGAYRWVEANGRVERAPDGTPLRFPGVLLDIEERRAIEAERDRATVLLRTFTEAVPGVVYAKDRDGRLLVANRGTSELLGLPPEAYIGRTDAEVLEDKAEAAAIMANDRRVMESGETEQVEEEVRLADGSPAYWLSTKTPLRDADGRVVGLVGSSVDITERRRVEDALRRSEERLRVAQATGGIGTFELIPETGTVVVSEQFCRLWGVAPVGEAPVGMFLDLIHPDDRERVVTGRSALPERALAYIEYRIVRPDSGEIRWIAREGEAVQGADGGTRHFGVCYDITARKIAEERLVEESRTLETINRTGEAVAAELDLERVVQMVTDAGVSLTGADFGAFFYNVLDERGESYMLYTLSGVDRAAFENFPMPRNTAVFGPTFDGEGVIRSDDILADPRYGRSEPYRGMPKGHLPVRSYLAVPVQSRSGEVIGGLFFGHKETGRFEERHERLMAGIAGQAAIAIDNARLYQAAQREIDEKRAAEAALRELNETLEQRVQAAVAEREQAEEALRQAQKMEAVGQLTGGLAHDFNNLLTGIGGSLEMMRMRIAQGRLGEVERYSNAAQGAVERAAALTHRLLAFSRRQTLDPKPTNLNRLVSGMEELVRRTVGPAVQVEVLRDSAVWATLVDPNQLENALLNLCINARDAMPGGGRLTIETANRVLDASAAAVRDLPAGDYVTLAVTDTGTGMPPEVVAKAFDPFFTTKPLGEGTGLGLSMIYGFARQSGGQVRIDSEVGRGTTMTIHLPRHDAHVPADGEEAGAERTDLSGDGEVVLVIDDEPTVRMLVGEVLADAGFSAIEAGDGPSGLKILQSNARIDLLITDVGLPGGMNGRQVADAARALRPGLRILFITGYAENAVIGDGRLEPGMSIVTKPFQIEMLARKIREALE
ncbi:PAS domain-containing protein [Sphingomonas parva]|uniref:PAS domain-containing protein n=1 Tax=Sphingomonas parva TaxID=2555898 RepID=UPI001CDBAA23|nr:PAS domain-containing protein [Sphingomonas parva]